MVREHVALALTGNGFTLIGVREVVGHLAGRLFRCGKRVEMTPDFELPRSTGRGSQSSAGAGCP